mmetsp:Transcript_31327/g.105477  ORF Transcript_31327/g.105477 Transcript_31327/m.105477 type:complete len:246 (+) Transcript_31327:13-750(+)
MFLVAQRPPLVLRPAVLNTQRVAQMPPLVEASISVRGRRASPVRHRAWAAARQRMAWTAYCTIWVCASISAEARSLTNFLKSTIFAFAGLTANVNDSRTARASKKTTRAQTGDCRGEDASSTESRVSLKHFSPSPRHSASASPAPNASRPRSTIRKASEFEKRMGASFALQVLTNMSALGFVLRKAATLSKSTNAVRASATTYHAAPGKRSRHCLRYPTSASGLFFTSRSANVPSGAFLCAPRCE